jgi:hypothetical protein
MTAYSATKAMQLSLAKSLANLTKGTAVTVNTISPGSTKTHSGRPCGSNWEIEESGFGSQELQNGRTARPFESGKAGGRCHRETFWVALEASGSSSRFYNSWSVIPHWCSLDIYVSRSVAVPTGEQNSLWPSTQRNAITGTTTGSISTKITNAFLSRREKDHPDQHSLERALRLVR